MWDQGSKGWDQRSQTMGSGSAVSYRDQGSGCITFVGSGTKIGHAFGIKDQKFAYKSDEKKYLVTTLNLRKQKMIFQVFCRNVLLGCP